VAGLVDLSARLSIKRLLKDDLLTFAIPFKMFEAHGDQCAGELPGKTYLEGSYRTQIQELMRRKINACYGCSPSCPARKWFLRPHTD